MTNYTFNQLTNTLTVTAAFLKKAGIYNSREYNIIKALRKDFPEMKIETVAKKNTVHHITFAQMKEFLSFIDNEINTNYLEQYEKVKTLSKIQASPYNYVKTWFENSFPNYAKQVTWANGKMEFITEGESKNEDAAKPIPLLPAA